MVSEAVNAMALTATYLHRYFLDFISGDIALVTEQIKNIDQLLGQLQALLGEKERRLSSDVPSAQADIQSHAIAKVAKASEELEGLSTLEVLSRPSMEGLDHLVEGMKGTLQLYKQIEGYWESLNGFCTKLNSRQASLYFAFISHN